jgi:hypothetical protein
LDGGIGHSQVKNHGYGKREWVGTEEGELLGCAIFFDYEISGEKSIDGPTIAVSHCDRNLHEVGMHLYQGLKLIVCGCASG